MTNAIAIALGNLRRNDLLTDAQVEAGIAALAAHPRVDAVERADSDPWGRAQVRIVARDTARGDLDRVIVLVDALNAMHRTRAEALADWEAMDRRDAAQAAVARQEAEYRALTEDEREAMGQDGAARLREAGIHPRTLVKVCNGLARGSHLPDADLEAWSIYVREVVRGRPRPMDLGRYVAGCVTH
ncbi:hypothetical protein [Methylorubrum extorquens]|uniref:hypothetical protein n=1 Tax=Methylorubrum extorquens TaxID=408 RepID=UPI0022381275|nr:hypothetical protein [Methylorubrum extorquens]UYW31942.1 hypothetical protein OKB92_23725 [Methylorubrum extorquens]